MVADCPLYTTDLFLCSCEERENEAEELRQQLQFQMSELKKAKDVCLLYEEEEQKLKLETRDIQRKLDEEKSRSASCDLQVHGWPLSWQRQVYLKFFQVTQFSGESHSEVSVGSSPRRPEEDRRSGATGSDHWDSQLSLIPSYS